MRYSMWPLGALQLPSPEKKRIHAHGTQSGARTKVKRCSPNRIKPGRTFFLPPSIRSAAWKNYTLFKWRAEGLEANLTSWQHNSAPALTHSTKLIMHGRVSRIVALFLQQLGLRPGRSGIRDQTPLGFVRSFVALPNRSCDEKD